MHFAIAGLLTLAVAIQPTPRPTLPAGPIEVDCTQPGALEKALQLAERLPEAEVVLDGVCVGAFAIHGGTVTLRATPGSGLAGEPDAAYPTAVLDVRGGLVTLRGLLVREGSVGLRAAGADTALTIEQVELTDQTYAGVWAVKGATVRMIDSEVGATNNYATKGEGAHFDFLRVRLYDANLGVLATEGASLVLTDSTIENCTRAVTVSRRSDADIYGGTFRNNRSHVLASGWSRASLIEQVTGPELGEPDDGTNIALAAIGYSSLSYVSEPRDIYGSILVADSATVRIVGGLVHGGVVAEEFGKAILTATQLEGRLVCRSGSDAYCEASTSRAQVGCLDTFCGPQEDFFPGEAPAETLTFSEVQELLGEY